MSTLTVNWFTTTNTKDYNFRHDVYANKLISCATTMSPFTFPAGKVVIVHHWVRKVPYGGRGRW